MNDRVYTNWGKLEEELETFIGDGLDHLDRNPVQRTFEQTWKAFCYRRWKRHKIEHIHQRRQELLRQKRSRKL